MFPFEPPDTGEAAADLIGTLTDAAWVLAAAVRCLEGGLRASYPPDDRAARVLAAAGLFTDTGSGLSPAPGVETLMARFGAAAIDSARSVLGQVVAVARGDRLDEGWAQMDDETLLAQGAASGRFVPAMFAMLFEAVPGVEERLRAPGARFLDVGVGVGGIACAVAETIPSLSVVGVDPFERAFRLASRNVAARGVGDRVSLRRCGLEDVDDQDAFDVAFVPAPFIPPAAFASGLERLAQAVRPGGWIVVAMGRLEGEGLAVEVTRWQTELIGGTPLTPDEASSLLRDAGFTDAITLDTPPNAPMAVVARRPD